MTRERAKRMPDGKIYHYIMSDAAVEKEDQAKKRWRAENYARLTADIPKEMMQKIADAAACRQLWPWTSTASTAVSSSGGRPTNRTACAARAGAMDDNSARISRCSFSIGFPDLQCAD